MAVEGGVALAASGDEQRSAGRRRGQSQGGQIVQLVERLSNIRGADHVLARPLRLAELEDDRSARRTGVRWIAGQYPIQVVERGVCSDVDVGSDHQDRKSVV